MTRAEPRESVVGRLGLVLYWAFCGLAALWLGGVIVGASLMMPGQKGVIWPWEPEPAWMLSSWPVEVAPWEPHAERFPAVVAAYDRAQAAGNAEFADKFRQIADGMADEINSARISSYKEEGKKQLALLFGLLLAPTLVVYLLGRAARFILAGS
ncbi:MAG: hypothetical protein RIM84_07795 [Alphaproteobacteria bacterium]